MLQRELICEEQMRPWSSCVTMTQAIPASAPDIQPPVAFPDQGGAINTTQKTMQTICVVSDPANQNPKSHHGQTCYKLRPVDIGA